MAFQSSIINVFYDLPDAPEAENNTLLNSTEEEVLQEALEMVAQPGAKWEEKGSRLKVLKPQWLELEAVAWMHLIKNHIMSPCRFQGFFYATAS